MMEDPFRVILSYFLRKKLQTKVADVGYVVGWQEGQTWICIDGAKRFDFFLQGMEHIGYFVHLEQPPPEDEYEFVAILKEHLVKKFEDLGYGENIVIISYETGVEVACDTIIKAVIFSSYYGTVKDIQVSDSPAECSNVCLFRARGQLPLIFEGSPDEGLQKENLEIAMGKLKNVFHSNIPVFYFESNNTMIKHTSEDSLLCKEFVKQLEEEGVVEKKKKKSKSGYSEKVPITFKILLQTTGQTAVENNVNHSLVIHCQRREFLCVTMHLPIDVIILAQNTLKLSHLYNLFIDAIVYQLDKFSQCLIDHHKDSQFSTPKVYHFHPYEWDFPVTVVYPDELSDNQLERSRKKIMSDLLLPLDRPLFRKISYCVSRDVPLSSGYLINPHVGLSPSGVQDGTTAIVYGRYAYHHYMQDRMNDNGWGCAYRSLQTIISWFQLQGYTDKSIPTHKEIQQALVEIGDKPASFVGSKQWIGSQEVSFCLDHLINVTSKIMFVSSGADLSSKGHELLYHFRGNGTPVMIGGGVLAHTIIGVDYNLNTGEVKFLVLDPHYTGGEDLSVIQSKGWCGWKSAQFWDQTAFYNLCLPQRPITV